MITHFLQSLCKILKSNKNLQNNKEYINFYKFPNLYNCLNIE